MQRVVKVRLVAHLRNGQGRREGIFGEKKNPLPFKEMVPGSDPSWRTKSLH